jgi:hypothetical protein
VRIFKTYGSDAIQVMTENPYRLARDIRGIGFKTADAIAMKLGIEKTAMVRVRAGISYALTEAKCDFLASSAGTVVLPAQNDGSEGKTADTIPRFASGKGARMKAVLVAVTLAVLGALPQRASAWGDNATKPSR